MAARVIFLGLAGGQLVSAIVNRLS